MNLKLTNVRLSFPALFEPKAAKAGDKPKFSCSFLIPKGDPQIAVIQNVIEQVANEKWGAKAPGILKTLIASLKTPLHDGETKAYDGYEGMMYINGSSDTAPLVINYDRSPLYQRDGKPYAGCYVNCAITIWAQDNQHGKRINAKLRGVQFVKDGEAFGSSSPASVDEFDVIEPVVNNDLI